MRDDIDFDCGPIVSGEMTVAEAGEAIFDTLLNVASGTRSKSEELGYGGSEFVPWLIGATM
jgi:altronate dehydratase